MRKQVLISAVPPDYYFGQVTRFIESNQGKPVEVLWETKDFTRVRDEDGEEVSLEREHVTALPNFRTIGQELTFGRR